MNERFDLKRFALLNKKRVFIVIVGAILGAAIFGLIYYIKAVIMAGPDMYRCKSMYYISFDTEEFEAVHDYYNDYTWNVVLDSDQIVGKAAKQLGIDKQIMVDATLVPTMSDIRVIWVYVDHEDAELALEMQTAIGEALVSFGQETEGFASIDLWDGPMTELVEKPVFVARNVIFGCAVGAIAGLLILLYMNAADSSIYTFEDFKNRYGVYPVGMIFKDGSTYSDSHLKEQLNVIISEAKSTEVNVFFAEALNEGVEPTFDVEKFAENVIPSGVEVHMLKHEEDEDFLAKVRTIVMNIILVRMGNDDFGGVTRTINNAKLMGIEIGAYILVDGNEAFYKAYYKAGK